MNRQAWLWLILVILAALVVLPIYIRWFGWVVGAEVVYAILGVLMPLRE